MTTTTSTNPAEAAARLFTRDGRQPALEGVAIRGTLQGLLFEFTVEQRFRNREVEHLEVIYAFPLPPGAVLLDVAVALGSKRLKGQVLPRRSAEQRYEQAVAGGDAAILVERTGDGGHVANLGNLAPGETCTLSLRFAQALAFEQGSLRVSIPTTIAPRYGCAVRDGGLLPHQVPLHSVVAETPLEFSVTVRGDLARARLSSPSHAIAVQALPPGERAPARTPAEPEVEVRLATGAWLDRDVVLLAEGIPRESLAVTAPDPLAGRPGASAALLAFCPRVPPALRDGTRAGEPLALKVLVDCSGSMAGDSLAAARRALLSVLRSLNDGDRFSLSRFGSTVVHRTPRLWVAGDASRVAAERWVAGLEADLGGTEMAGALRSVFALPPVRADVLLVTDGQIEAIEPTVAAARASGHRVFAVGVGSAPAMAQLLRLAEATGGACDVVAPGEAVEPAVRRMAARLRTPQVSGLALAWPAGVTPRWVSPLPAAVFDGDALHVRAWFDVAPGLGDFDVKLVGDDGERAEVGRLGERGARRVLAGVRVNAVGATVEGGAGGDVAAAALECTAGDALPRLVAYRRVETTDIAAGDPAAAVSAAQAAAEIAERYRLVTEHTHFVLVHERAAGEKAGAMPQLHVVPQMLAAGWGGTAMAARDVRYGASPALAAPDVSGLHPDAFGATDVAGLLMQGVASAGRFRATVASTDAYRLDDAGAASGAVGSAAAGAAGEAAAADAVPRFARRARLVRELSRPGSLMRELSPPSSPMREPPPPSSPMHELSPPSSLMRELSPPSSLMREPSPPQHPPAGGPARLRWALRTARRQPAGTFAELRALGAEQAVIDWLELWVPRRCGSPPSEATLVASLIALLGGAGTAGAAAAVTPPADAQIVALMRTTLGNLDAEAWPEVVLTLGEAAPA